MVSPFREAAAAAPPNAAQTFALQHLRGDRVYVGSAIPNALWLRAIGTLNAGPDATVGEAAVALVASDFDPGPNCNGVIFTDRRLIARSDETFVDVRYDELVEARGVKGIVYDDLYLHLQGRAQKLAGLQAMAPVLAFVQAMCATHPSYRLTAPSPLTSPTSDDPTGAIGARATLPKGDPRSRALLDIAEGTLRRGLLPLDRAGDLAARAVMLDRTLAYGQGSSGGWWTSPLAAKDLADAFTRMIGPAVRAWDLGGGRVFQHRLKGSGAAVGSLASTGLGLASLAIFGIGWVSVPGHQVTDVNVHIVPGPFATGFTLFENNQPLARNAPGLVEAVFERLPQITARRLLQRAVWGWDADPTQLDHAPVEEFVQRVYAAAGPVDLDAFFPRG
jgi:hypothetical protein